VKRSEKEATVAELHEKFQNAQAAILAEYRGLTVAESNQLRRDLERESASFRVVKNSLARRAVEDTEYACLGEAFGGPIGVAFADQDPAAAAKVIAAFAKAHPLFVVRAGALGGKLLSAEDVDALSKLPSLDELRGQLVGVLAGPVRGLVTVLSGVPRNFVQVLNAIQEKKAA
jgi:large subunit ribosomal protein L10